MPFFYGKKLCGNLLHNRGEHWMLVNLYFLMQRIFGVVGLNSNSLLGKDFAGINVLLESKIY
jgi:hypothetical protein